MDDTGNFHDSVYSGDDEKRGNAKISQGDHPLNNNIKDSNEALINTEKTDFENQNKASKALSKRFGSKLSGVPLDINETQKRVENGQRT